ncbi:glycosyltransferase [Enterococcus villorum]|uniref:Colanic acid biosynthesis glycosyltransferase WcaL n=2 Tax=Enterococcus villorum TaxID=112904 RepID=A0A511J3J2_9ENTE|nr:glycosyltransferase [Enterococcus villorum]EOH92002.1 hypothetical protein UAO_00673 [Enterococcus villorum ATCC 700913]EOW76718.1 hypothetical protein I591_02026 [Enterococcus villorum ATCC 700913]GEL92524.1 colanic acid biosynthesis glycosyltransferase WcaL [Enterococcus villorum]
MKLLFFVSSFPALSETFILNQITGMIDLGHDVEILATKKVETTKKHPEIEQYGLLDKVTYIEIPSNLPKKVWIATKAFFKTVKHSPKRAIGLINGRKQGKFVYSLRPLIVNTYFEAPLKFDAIISHYGYNTLLLEIIKAQYEKFPPIYGFFHGNDVTGFVQRFGEDIYYPLQRKTNTTALPISEQMADRLEELNILPLNRKVHHMGVDLTKFPKVPFKGFSEELQLLIVGRLTEKKGMDITISALKKLQDNDLKVQLTIIGEGEWRNHLEELTDKLQLSASVHLIGAKSQEEVRQAIKEADLLLLPSKTATDGDQEGIPVSLMEALASGKLVISTYHSGIPELIKNNKNGWLVPENDSQQLADKIQEVVKMTPEECQRISQHATESVEQFFNIKKLNDTLSQLIRSNQ